MDLELDNREKVIKIEQYELMGHQKVLTYVHEKEISNIMPAADRSIYKAGRKEFYFPAFINTFSLPTVVLRHFEYGKLPATVYNINKKRIKV